MKIDYLIGIVFIIGVLIIVNSVLNLTSIDLEQKEMVLLENNGTGIDWLVKSSNPNWSEISINMDLYEEVACECTKNTNTPCLALCFKLKEQPKK